MRNKVLVTGASGYLARDLIGLLCNKGEQVIALTSNAEKTEKELLWPGIEVVENDAVLDGLYPLDEVKYVVHTAFCRRSDGKLLVNSLEYMRHLVNLCVAQGVEAFINISSQAVYGSSDGKKPNEEGIKGPDYLYAFAKYTSELLVEKMHNDGNHIMRYTNIRLASLMGPGKIIPQNVLYKFIVKALNGERFSVIGGEQEFSFLHVKDAAEAIVLLLGVDSANWKTAYNLGPETQTSILAMADLICEKVKKYTNKNVGYDFIPKDIYLKAGMDSSLIYNELHWKPRYSFEMIVEDTMNAVIYANGVVSGHF